MASRFEQLVKEYLETHSREHAEAMAHARLADEEHERAHAEAMAASAARRKVYLDAIGELEAFVGHARKNVENLDIQIEHVDVLGRRALAAVRVLHDTVDPVVALHRAIKRYHDSIVRLRRAAGREDPIDWIEQARRFVERDVGVLMPGVRPDVRLVADVLRARGNKGGRAGAAGHYWTAMAALLPSLGLDTVSPKSLETHVNRARKNRPSNM